MERHLHTKEALFGTSERFVVAIAKSRDGNTSPLAEDIISIIVEPGELIVLDEGIWHDACHGIDGFVKYYWLAAEDLEVKNEWIEIDGGPVELVY